MAGKHTGLVSLWYFRTVGAISGVALHGRLTEASRRRRRGALLGFLRLCPNTDGDKCAFSGQQGILFHFSFSKHLYLYLMIMIISKFFDPGYLSVFPLFQ